MSSDNLRPVPTTNSHLLNLIRTKRKRHWKPSLSEQKQGFRGWHQRGYLPHFDAPFLTQMLTFLLHDSFPTTRRGDWEPILNCSNESEKRWRLEDWLDRGYGECWLRQGEIAEVVEETMLSRNGIAYQLLAWIVMPNHVHVVVDIWNLPASSIVKHWKGVTGRNANHIVGRLGPFWQKDYYDTLIRDEDHCCRAIRYTEANAASANLVRRAQDWKWSSARRRDEYGRLPFETRKTIC